MGYDSYDRTISDDEKGPSMVELILSSIPRGMKGLGYLRTPPIEYSYIMEQKLELRNIFFEYMGYNGI